MPKILITAAGSGGTNGLIETLNDSSYTFVGINAKKFKAVCSITDSVYILPSASEKNYLSELNRLIDKEKPDLLIANSDAEVSLISKHRDEVHTKVFLPDEKSVTLCEDKYAFYNFCIKHHIKTAKTFQVKQLDNLEPIFSQFSEFPLWCRIRSGAGSKHTSKVYSSEHALQFIQHVMQAYNVPLDEFLISEYLPGKDVAIHTQWHEGKLVLCKMAERVSYLRAAGESPPNVIKTFFDEKVKEFAIDVVTKLSPQANGIFNIDLKYDKDGNIAITEINPGRFYYNMPLFNLSGKHNSFSVFLNTVFSDTIDYDLSDDEEVFFFRDMDNKPRIFRANEIEEKISTI